MNSRWLTLPLALLGLACGDTPPTDPEPAPTSQGFVSAGVHHTCGFNAAGETWCWGLNDYGELGSTSDSSPVPVQARITGLAEVASGDRSTCGRKTDGTLWCWGRILGEDEDMLRSPPQQLTVFGSDVQYIAMAEETAYVGKKDGSIWTYIQGVSEQVVASGAGQLSVHNFGDAVCFVKTDGNLGCQALHNDYGELGDGTTNGGSVQVKVPAGTLFQQVSVGGNFACGLTTAGEVWCWGANDAAQTGTRESTQNCGNIPCNPTPRKISGLPGPAKAIVTSSNTALAVLTDGTVWGWGGNADFELGGPTSETCTNLYGNNEPCSSTPVKVPVQNMVNLSAGWYHVCGCDKDGVAWCWGSSGNGKLGTTSLPNSSGSQPPVQVQNFRCK